MDEETARQIKDHYIHGRGSIQDLARIYRLSVEEVLNLIGEGSSARVYTQGDMIDQNEAGPGVQLNHGKEFNVPFTLD